MAEPGDAISVSLDDVAVRLRAIAGRRAAFPAPAAVARVEGPSGGASQEFSLGLRRAAADVARLTAALTTQLDALETDIAATGRALVEADASVADDVDALVHLLGGVPAPAPSAVTPAPGVAPHPVAPYPAAPYPAAPDPASPSAPAATGLG